MLIREAGCVLCLVFVIKWCRRCGIMMMVAGGSGATGSAGRGVH